MDFHNIFASDFLFYNTNMEYVILSCSRQKLKGAGSRERFQKVWQKWTDLGLNKGRSFQFSVKNYINSLQLMQKVRLSYIYPPIFSTITFHVWRIIITRG